VPTTSPTRPPSASHSLPSGLPTGHQRNHGRVVIRRRRRSPLWSTAVGLILSLLVIAGAIDRLATTTPEVQGLPALVVSVVAAAGMLGGALVLGGDASDDKDEGGALNIRAVFLDTAADAAVAGGVAITGGVIVATGGLFWLDPGVALVISAVIAYQAVHLVGRVLAVLRRGS
jgi:cobalt-zinc-cadmium efflux system protein